MVKKTAKEEYFMTHGLYKIQISMLVSINKVLWEHSYTDSFTYYIYSCSHTTMAELSSCHKDHMAIKVKNIYCEFWGDIKKYLLRREEL